MKKLLCVFLALLATVCLLSTLVSAAPPPPQLSEDLQSMTYYGKTYSVVDLSTMVILYDGSSTSVQVPKSLQSQIEFATMRSTSNDWVISVTVNYLNGANMMLTFARDDVLPELQQICQSDEVVCFVDFWWENSISVEAALKQFKGKPATLSISDVSRSDYYDVMYEYSPLGTCVYRGFVCQKNEKFYYVDYRENHISDPVNFYPAVGPQQYKAYEITDPWLVDQINETVAAELSGSSDLGQRLSAGLLTFLFAVIPGAILIFSIICFIRTKNYYRITWGITGGLCIAELILFTILALIL